MRQCADSVRGQLAKCLCVDTASVGEALPVLHVSVVSSGSYIHEVNLVLCRHDFAQVHSLLPVNRVPADAEREAVVVGIIVVNQREVAR